MRSVFYQQSIGGILFLAPAWRHLANVRLSMIFLKERDVVEYERVVRNLRAVLIHRALCGYNTLRVVERVFIAGMDLFEGDYDIPYIASLFVHEAYHVAQYRSGHDSSGDRAERAAYLRQRSFLSRVGYQYAVEWLDAQYNRSWWTAMEAEKSLGRSAMSFYENFRDKKLKVKVLEPVVF